MWRHLLAGYLYKRLQGANPVEAGKFAAAMCTIKLEHNGTVQPHHRRCNENHSEITDGAIPTFKRRAVSYSRKLPLFRVHPPFTL